MSDGDKGKKLIQHNPKLKRIPSFEYKISLNAWGLNTVIDGSMTFKWDLGRLSRVFFFALWYKRESSDIP